jgi:hypothetical protein
MGATDIKIMQLKAAHNGQRSKGTLMSLSS